MEVVVTTGAIRCAKLQSNHHCQHSNTQPFTGQSPSCHPINSALEGESITFHGLAHTKLSWGSSILVCYHQRFWVSLEDG